MTTRMKVAMVGMALLLSIAAGGAGYVILVRDSGSAQADLLRHQRMWERAGFVNYDYTGSWVCECAEGWGAEALITVRGGEVAAVDIRSSWPIDAVLYSQTIEDLFALTQAAIAGNADRVEVSYDETYGYPAELLIDYYEHMRNEERGFVVRSFTPR